jgi:hypothetical protein
MRLWLPFALIASFPLGALAQVPAGEYVRNYSPGYAGESLTITEDSAFVRREWTDTSVMGSPATLYLGDAGTLDQSGATIALDYRHAVLDSVALAARSDWSEPVDAWVSRRLDNQQQWAPSLIVGEVDGLRVLAWPEDASRIAECERQLSAWEPDDLDILDDEAAERRRALRDSCGMLFLPDRLSDQLDHRASFY